MAKRTVLLIVAVFLISCVSGKTNRDYIRDSQTMSDNDFTQKYFTLYSSHPIDFSKLKKNSAYSVMRNNGDYQIVIFAENKFVYTTSLLPETKINKSFTQIRLSRNDYYRVDGNVIRMEGYAPAIGIGKTVIDEGVINGDTIKSQKRYNATGIKNEHELHDTYVLMPDVSVFVFGNDIYIEKKSK